MSSITASRSRPSVDHLVARVMSLIVGACLALDTLCVHGAARRRGLTCRATPARDRGQATTEYALVMLAAALVALLVVAWATAGGGAGKVGRLFDRILDEVIGRV